jgi:hypothetical protein
MNLSHASSERQLEDAHGRQWSFVEKTAIVNLECLGAQSSSGQQGVLAGEVLSAALMLRGRE